MYELSIEKHRERVPYIIQTVPPSVDSKTWAEIQSRWIEVRLKEVEVEKENTKAFIELTREIMDNLKDYYLKKIPNITWPAYILVGVVVLGATILTGLGKVEGETFSFLMGTIVGYIISLLSKRT